MMIFYCRNIIRFSTIVFLFSYFDAFAQRETKQLGFLLDESNTFDWTQDIGIARSEITECANTNDAAKWADICSLIKSQQGNFFSFQLSSEAAIRNEPPFDGGPTILLTLRADTLVIEFKKMTKASKRVREETNSDLKLKIDLINQKFVCEVLGKGKQDQIVEKSWEVESSENSDTAIVLPYERESLAENLIKPKDVLTCKIIAFDGILYKKYTHSERAEKFKSPTFAQNFVKEFDRESFKKISLADFVGQKKSSEAYTCKHLQKTQTPFSLCTLFNMTTGQQVFSETNTSIRDVIFGKILFHSRLVIGIDKKGSAPKQIFDVFVDSRPESPGEKEKTPKTEVKIQNKGIFQFLSCSSSSERSGLQPETYRWRVNGVELLGWNNEWLTPIFFHFGSEISCTDRTTGDFSKGYIVGSSDVLIYGSNAAVFSDFKEEKYLKVEPSIYIPPQEQNWECKASVEDFGCSVVNTPGAQSRFIKITPKNQNLVLKPTSYVTVTLKSSSLKTEIAQKKIQIEFHKSPATKFLNISEITKVEESESHYTCASEDSRLSYSAKYYWHLNGKLISQERKLSKDSIQNGQSPFTITCFIAIETENGIVYANASKQILNDGHIYQGLPDEVVLDFLKPFNFIFSPGNLKFNKVSCSIHSATRKNLTPNICRKFGQHMSFQNMVSLSLSKNDLNKLKESIKSIYQSEKELLDGFNLEVTFQGREYKTIKTFPLRVLFPNTRPEINNLFAYFDDNGIPSCAIFVSDVENNHLTATMFPAGQVHTPINFSTFQKEGATKLKLSNSVSTNIVGANVLHYFATHAFKDAVGFMSSSKREAWKCDLVLSDGTLVKKSQSEFKNLSEIRPLFVEKTDHKSLFSASLANTIIPAAQNTAKPTEESEEDSTRVIVAKELGPVVLLDDPLFSKRKLLSCEGIKKVCGALRQNQGKITFENTSVTPPGILHLMFKSQSGAYISLTVEYQNESFDALEEATQKPCYDLMTSYMNGSIASDLSPYFAVGIKGDRSKEVPVPASLIGEMLGAGVSELNCNLRLHSKNSQKPTPSPTKVTMESQLPLHLRKPKPPHLLFHSAEARHFLNLDTASFRIQNLDLIPFVFATDSRITECNIQGGERNEKCTLNPLNHHLTYNSDRLNWVDYTHSYKFLGVSYSLENQVSILNSSLFQLNELISVSIAHLKNGKLLCHGTQANASMGMPIKKLKFSVYDDQKNSVPFRVQDDENIEIDGVPLQSKIIFCEVTNGINEEVAVMASGTFMTESRPHIDCLAIGSEIIKINCDLSPEQIRDSSALQESVKEAISIQDKNAYKSIKYVYSDGESIVKNSEMIVLHPEAESLHNPRTSGYPRENMATYWNATLASLTCFYGIDYSASLAQARTTERSANKMVQCGQLQRLPMQASDLENKNLKRVYLSSFEDKDKASSLIEPFLFNSESFGMDDLTEIKMNLKRMAESSPKDNQEVICSGKSLDLLNLCSAKLKSLQIDAEIKILNSNSLEIQNKQEVYLLAKFAGDDIEDALTLAIISQ